MSRRNRQQVSRVGFQDPGLISPSEADAVVFGQVQEQLERISGTLAEGESPTSPNSLIALGDGRYQLGGFVLSSVGLQVSAEIDIDEWRRLGEVLLALQKRLAWLLGDWIVYGEQYKWGETYQQLAAEYGYEVSTLHTYAWVCRSVEFSIRIENLEFAHHRLVATLPQDEQRQWLELAVKNNLSVSQLRAAMLGKPPTLPDPGRALNAIHAQIHTFGQLTDVLTAVGEGDVSQLANLGNLIAAHKAWLRDVEALYKSAKRSKKKDS